MTNPDTLAQTNAYYVIAPPWPRIWAIAEVAGLLAQIVSLYAKTAVLFYVGVCVCLLAAFFDRDLTLLVGQILAVVAVWYNFIKNWRIK